MAKKKQTSLVDLQKELDRRKKQRAFSLEAVAGNHGPQLAYLKSTALFALALCSRRAGKSFANMALLAHNAMNTIGTTNLYLGLTEKAVKYSIIPKLWNRLVKTYSLPFTDLNADLVAVCTTTGSIVRFASVDDQAHIFSFLGDELAGGLVIIDEAQALPFALLQNLVEVVIIPALSSTTEEHPLPGRLVLSGTIPQVAAGYFYSKWIESDGWEKFNWNRFENPFLKNQDEALARTLKALGVGINHPLIRRDWFGELVFDLNDTAYRYVSERSTYVPLSIERKDIGPFHCSFAPLNGCDRLIVGVDPAQKRDRFAIVALAYNSSKRDRLIQVSEAVTDPGADPYESEWLEILKVIKSRYGIIHRVIRDPGSSAPTNDLLQHSHGILIEAAIKGPGSLKGRVDFLADLLQRGTCLVIKDGELDKDLASAKWDLNELEKGHWKFSKVTGSPDVSDACSYIAPFFTALGGHQPSAKPSSEDAYWAEQSEKHLAKVWADSNKRPQKRRTLSVAANLYRLPRTE
jgi:hypothetical protein